MLIHLEGEPHKFLFSGDMLQGDPLRPLADHIPVPEDFLFLHPGFRIPVIPGFGYPCDKFQQIPGVQVSVRNAG